MKTTNQELKRLIELKKDFLHSTINRENFMLMALEEHEIDRMIDGLRRDYKTLTDALRIVEEYQELEKKYLNKN